MLNHKHQQIQYSQWQEVNIYNPRKQLGSVFQIYKGVLQHRTRREELKQEISRKHWARWANQ